MSIYQEFRTSFTDKDYKYTTTVLHSGFVVAFAMDDERKIYYTVLDSMQAPVELPEPRLLFFPEEITTVGYGVFYPTPMPIVKDNTREEVEEGRIDKEDQDPFLSTTACLTADQPFQIFSDGSYIYLFRQAINKDHNDMVYPTGQRRGERGTRDQQREDIFKDPDGNPVPVVNQTLLVDRFVFALGGEPGPTLQPKLEIRYQRSKHKTLRQSNKDTLGTQDMAENKFYEPTQELSLVGKMHEGMFSVLQLPTQVNQQKRWQIFCYNNTTGLLDSYNIEVAKDGLFNTFGTRHYTSPDPEYQSAVFERQPGICPFTKKPLILITDNGGAAESALRFTGDNCFVDVRDRMDIFRDNSFTIECWAKAENFDNPKMLFLIGDPGVILTGGIIGGRLNFQISSSDQITSSETYTDTDWHHYAFVYNKDNKKMEIYRDGVQVAEGTANDHAKGKGSFHIGKSGSQYFQGNIDEMRVWNYPRLQVQIEQEMNYRLVGNETGLMNYWRFDEGSGNTVYDKTNRACHGIISGENKPQWVVSDAPVGDNPGVSRTSIKLNRGLAESSFSSLFYYEQETNDTDGDGIKHDGRVMLAIPGSDESKIIILDMGVGSDGKLAQIPDMLNLPLLGPPPRQTLEDVDPKQLKQRAYSISNDKQDLQETKKQILKIRQQLQELDKLPSKKELEAKQTALATIAQELKRNYRPEQPEYKKLVKRWQELTSPTKPLSSGTLSLVKDKIAVQLEQVLNKEQELPQKQQELAEKLKQMAELNEAISRNQAATFKSLLLLAIDPYGLTVKGGALDFARTTIRPDIRECGPDKLGLYFQREGNQQFSVAYFDITTAKAKFTSESDSENTLTWLADNGEAEMDNAEISITDGSTPETCTLTIKALGYEETWTDTPRKVDWLQQLINQGVTEFEQEEENKKESTITAVKTLKYNSQERAVVYSGSMLFNLSLGVAPLTSLIVNGTATKSGNGKTTGWTSPRTSESLRFDADDYISTEDEVKLKGFDSDADAVTLETWIKPTLIPGKDDIDENLPVSAMQFNGDTYINCGDQINLANKSFTIEFWVRRMEKGRSDWIISQGWINTNKNLHIGFRDDNRFAFAFYYNDIHYDGSSLDNNWHHWACVYDSNAQSRKIYCDGIEVASQNSGVASYQGYGNLYICQHHNSKAKVEMMEVRVWQSARNQEQIQNNFRKQLQGTEEELKDLVAYWKLDKLNSVTQPMTRFDRAGHYYTDAEEGINVKNKSFTIEYWAKRYNEKDEDWIVCKHDATDKNYKRLMFGKYKETTDGKSRKIAFRVDNTHIVESGRDDERTKRWNHYAAVMNPDGSPVVYINGEKISTQDNWQKLYPYEGGSWKIGAPNESANDFSGEVAEVRIWSYARSQDEIKRNMNRWIEKPQEGLMASWRIDSQNTVQNLAKPGTGNLKKHGTLFAITGETRNRVEDSSHKGHFGSFDYDFQNNAEAPLPEVIEAPDISLELPDAPSNCLIYHYNDKPRNSLNISHYAISMLPRYSFRFNGENWIGCGQRINLTNKSFTIEFWAQRQGEARDDWFLNYGPNQANKGLNIGFRNNNQFTFAFYSNDLDCDTRYSDTNWHHWACVYDYQAKSRKIYRDGVLVASQDSGVNPFQGTGTFQLGSRSYSQLNAKADLVELRIWNSARTQEQIRESMGTQLNSTTAGLVAYWRLDGSDVSDRSGNGHDGNIEGPIVLGAAPLFSLTTRFDNHTYTSKQGIFQNSWTHLAFAYLQSYGIKFHNVDVLEAPDATALQITKDLTLELFCQPAEIKETILLAKTGDSSNNAQLTSYKLEMNKNGHLVFSCQNQDGNWKTFTSSNALTANKLQKVAVVRKTEISYQTRSETVQIGDQTETVEYDVPQTTTQIIFYIDGQEVGTSHKFKDINPGIGNFPVKMGESFNGMISDIRIWNVALEPESLGQLLYGQETGGLVAWWSLNEKEGNIIYDSVGENHAKITGTKWQWVKNTDYDANLCFGYLNGQPVEFRRNNSPSNNQPQFSLGAAKDNEGDFANFLHGEMDEIRIWKTLRLQRQIQENLFTYVKGEKKDLIAYFSCNLTENANLLKDESFTGNDLTFPTNDNNKPTRSVSNAPIGDDIALVRSAIDGYTQQYQTVIDGFPSVVDYGVMFNDPNRGTSGSLQRLYTYIYNNQWHLVHGFKVANLKTQWMAQVQFDPQIIGFIEGAPPVPSENLTVGPENYQASYDGTTAVEVTEVNSYNYSYSHSRNNSAQNGFEQEAKNGGEIDLSFVLAPLGIGKTIDIDLAGAGTGATQLNSDNSYTSEKAISVGKTTTENTTQQLKGYWQPLPDPEQNYEPPAYNPILGPRYVPENIGLALVISKTADIFALRFEHNNALFSYSIRPNQDIPPDFNLIPFKINPQYTKQGTLDGKIGYNEQGAIFLDPDYPTASDYGEYSYFKPKEAYNLKEEINRKEKDLAAYYENFNVGYGEGWATDVGIDYAANLGASAVAGGIGGGLGNNNRIIYDKLGQPKRAGGFGAWFTSQISALASLASTTSDIGKAFERENNKDQALPDKFAKQNIVNTYVWSADGGFYSQSSETTQSRTESYEGSFNFSFQSGATSELEIKFEFSASEFKSTGFTNLGVSLTRSRAKEQEETFELQTTFDLSNNIQKYDYSGDPSKPDPVYDADSNPVLCPGKVDAYRFMTFFLQEDNENYNQLFNKVIDPMWLNNSNDKNAIALRGARNDGKTPSCWRVMHRVTFVSRILPEIGAETPPLEKELKELDISSYYELIKRLEPFVVSSADSYDNLLRAVNNTLAKYAPSLMSYNKDITLILCYYYGVDLPSELEDDLAFLSQTYSSMDYSLPEADPVAVETQED